MVKGLQGLYESVILDNARAVLVILLLLTVVLGVAAPNIKLDASADSLTLQNDSDVDYFRETVTAYGVSDYLVITYTPKQALFSDHSLQVLQSMSDELLALELVESIDSILNLPLLNSPRVSLADIGDANRTLMTPDTDRKLAEKEFHEGPVYRNMVLSDDGNTTAMLVNLVLDEKFYSMVDRRDELRLKKKTQGLTPEEKIELEKVSADFLVYRTALQEKSAANIESVRSIMEKYSDDADMHLGGVSMITSDMIDFIQRDLQFFGTGVMLFIVIMLAVIFRQLRWVLLPLACCSLSAIYMLGYLAMVDWRLTVISSNFVALLLIITLSMTIHLVVRYRELARLKPEASQRELVVEMASFMAKPCFYTILTTAVAFASLVVSDIRPIIDFGWMMTIGLSVAFVLVFLVIPCALVLMPRSRPDSGVDFTRKVTMKMASFAEHYGNAILLIYLVLTLVSIYGLFQLKVENRFIDYFDESTEIYQGMELIDKKLGGTTPFDIIIDVKKEEEVAAAPAPAPVEVVEKEIEDEFGGAFEDDFGDESEDEGVSGDSADEFADGEFGEDDPFADDGFGEGDSFSSEQASPGSYWFTRQGLGKIEELHDYVESLSVTGKVMSLATTWEMARQINGGSLNDFELIFLYQTLPPEIRSAVITPYLNEERNQARISIRVMESDHSLRRGELIETIREYATTELGFDDEQIHFTNMLVLYNNMLVSLFKSQILTLGAVFVGILLMFMVLFRNFQLALVAIIPNVIAASWVLGTMGLMGVPLDMMTITIAAIVIGIGVDDCIHYIHRFKKEFRQDRNYLNTMYRSHGSIGKAMYYTTVTIMAGFSILAFSQFTPSLYFGLLTSCAMFAALVGALLLLPKLILVLKPLGADETPAENQP